MPVGIEVRNNAGRVQIDGTYRNWGLIAKGNISTTTQWMFVGNSFLADHVVEAQIATISFVAESPLLAFHSASMVCVMGTTRAGDTWTVTLFAPFGANIDYYVYDVALPNPAGPGYGAQVFDAAGRLVFDARYSPPLVVGHPAGAMFNGGPVGQTYDEAFAFPGGIKLAVACVLTPATEVTIVVNSSTNFRSYFGIGGWDMSAGVANLRWRALRFNRGGSSGEPSWPSYGGYRSMLLWSALILDVTNA